MLTVESDTQLLDFAIHGTLKFCFLLVYLHRDQTNLLYESVHRSRNSRNDHTSCYLDKTYSTILNNTEYKT